MNCVAHIPTLGPFVGHCMAVKQLPFSASDLSFHGPRFREIRLVGSVPLQDSRAGISDTRSSCYLSGREHQYTSGSFTDESDNRTQKELYNQIDQVDFSNYAFLLRQYGNTKSLSKGMCVHHHIVERGHDRDRFIGNLLIQMYGKCGSFQDATAVLARMDRPNVFSWTIIIGAYTQYGQGHEAFRLFQQMILQGMTPNKVTCSSILSAFTSSADLSNGKQLHCHILHGGFESDVVVGNSLVNMYGKCGSLDDAQRMFDKMPECDAISCNTMIAAYKQQGHGKEAYNLYHHMHLEGLRPDRVTFLGLLSACASDMLLAEGKNVYEHIITYGLDSDIPIANSTINMFGKCKTLEDSWTVFDKMPVRNVVSWTAMVTTYAQLGYGKDALHLFEQMQEQGVTPDKLTFASIIDVCGNLAALGEGKQIHGSIIDVGFELDLVLGNTLVMMYGKCGCLEDSRRMFEKMPERDVISWSSIISACAQHGRGKESLDLFQQMQSQGVIPNEVTFFSILSACSHAGLVGEGCHFFISMSQDYGIKPCIEHCNCMMDLLGRAGHLKEGEDFANSIPNEPTDTTWVILLAACRNHLDVERGKRVAERVFCLKPNNIASYVSLSNIYAAAGRWNDSEEVRQRCTTSI